jgi:PIN domain nuclease of toxin-antitoxin system
LACADISLWEIAMLIEKGRLEVEASTEDFLTALIAARRLTVLPVTPAIAALSASSTVPEGDPADRLIAATAISHGATLITKDERLIGLPDLPTIW